MGSLRSSAIPAAVIRVMRCERYGRIINLASRSAEGAAPGGAGGRLPLRNAREFATLPPEGPNGKVFRYGQEYWLLSRKRGDIVTRLIRKVRGMTRFDSQSRRL